MPKAGVSKDRDPEAEVSAWFETPCSARLLTKR
jgi:hypothetical protein